MRKKIGECLVQAGLITEADLQTALAEHKRSGERLGAVLVRMNLATERQIAKALAYQLGFSYVNLAEHVPDPAAVVLIPKDVALKRTCISINVEKNSCRRASKADRWPVQRGRRCLPSAAKPKSSPLHPFRLRMP